MMAKTKHMNSGIKNEKTSASWKSRVYEAYVSSGQALRSRTDHADPKQFFSPQSSYVRRIIAQHIPPDREARILDLACGHGAYLYFLLSAGYTNVAGVDVSSEQVSLAHKLGIGEVECGDILSFLRNGQNASVDVVLMIDVLEHLTSEEMFEILDQVFRVLRSGGTCIAHVPNAEGLYGMRVRYGDLTHERAFAPRSAEQLFRTTGFLDVICFEDQPEMHGLKSIIRRALWKVGTLPHRLLLAAETGSRRFILSQNMLVIARKK
jgi:2-polyprenyl-3-methyl-5-hydroxy-6-metoxy-1,4-benzoquinol methylase